MSERKDKKKIVGEPMTDEQIKIFLHGRPEQQEDADFHDLLRAYRSLREEDFRRFLTFFCEANRNINAKALDGQSLSKIIASHRKSRPYLDALRACGAE